MLRRFFCLVSLDVGCGFTEGVQEPKYANVSLDLNMGRVQPRFLEKLRRRGSHPLGADACHLPIRNGIIHHIYWLAVLEHLPHPEAALFEGYRVLGEGGEAEIVLPIITSHMKHYLVILFTQFPFSLWNILVALWRAHLYWHIPGVPHLKIIHPQQLKSFFRDVEYETHYYRHKWFHNPWGRVTRKIVNSRYIPDIQGQYYVRCLK